MELSTKDKPLRNTILIYIVLAAGVIAPTSHAIGQQQDLTKFALDLYKNVVNISGADENIALSPFSTEAALAMMFVGAAGDTKSELGWALGLENDTVASHLATKYRSINSTSDSYALQSASAIFLEQSYEILPAFHATVTDVFGMNVSSVDFVNKEEQTRQQINSFVATNTNDKIQDLFPLGSLGSDSRLVLVNAVYFKADWDRKFNVKETTSQPFVLSNGQNTSVQLMSLKSSFGYTESQELGGAQVLELRYKKGETSMVVILPDRQTGLQGLEASLTSVALSTALGQLSRQKVDVFIPKFKVNTGYDLVPKLKAMGIQAAFTRSADFSGISPARDLQISKVAQKVFIEVDEQGTEAAAATGIQITMLSLPITIISPPVFRADRPFLYLIRHLKSNSILFIGRVADPTVEK